MQNFRSLGAPPPDPLASGGWRLCPQTPKAAPSLQTSGNTPVLRRCRQLCWRKLINTIFEAGKTKRAFYVNNLN